MEDKTYDQTEIEAMERLSWKITIYSAEALTKLDQLVTNLDEIKALVRARWGHHQQRGSSICNQKTPISTQNHNVTRVSEIGFTRMDGFKDYTGEEEDEGQLLKLGFPITTSTTVPTKTPFSSDSSPFLFDPSMTGDDGTKESQFEDNPIADPAPEIVDEQMEMAPPPMAALARSEISLPCCEIASDALFPTAPLPLLPIIKFVSNSVLFAEKDGSSRSRLFRPPSSMNEHPSSPPPKPPNRNFQKTTMEVQVTWNPPMLSPPPKPPDRGVVPAPSVMPHLSVTTTKGLEAIQYPKVYSYTTLLIALQVFDKMLKCHVAAWNAITPWCTEAAEPATYYHVAYYAMIDCLESMDRFEDVLVMIRALVILCLMLGNGVCLDKYSFPLVLKACSHVGLLKEGMQVHDLLCKTNFGSDVFLQNCLMGLFIRCGCIELAQQLFDRMHERDLVSWNTMIDGCVKHGKMEDAQTSFYEMPERGLVSRVTMIDGYAKSGNIVAARSLFDEMPRRDVISCNSMMAGYIQNCYCTEALKLLHDMRRVMNLLSVLTAIAQLGHVGVGIHRYLMDNGYCLSGKLGVALIDMYSKCGSIENAISVFENIEHKCVDHWNAGIGGLAIHGMGKLAFDFLMEMQRFSIVPDDITFIGVLSACGHLATTKEQAQQIEKTGKCMAVIILEVAAHHREIVAYTMLLHTKWSQFKVHLLARKREKYVAVLHRKMIHRGSVLTAKVLIKWKALPPKHGTWESSLRTRMS